MTKRVELTPIAKQNFEQITDYILEHWGAAATLKFIIRFEEICYTLITAPGLFSIAFDKGEVRKCVLTKQNVIYYREKPDVIEVIVIFDTRQDTQKLYELIDAQI
jgi:plasmid stabilization system protein ParE